MTREITVGMKIGNFEIVDPRVQGKKKKSWLCRCTCGKLLTLGETHLLGTPKRRPTRSCGCLRERQKGATIKYPKIYYAWHHMNTRCYNPENENYERYGAVGIRVCDEWRDDFLEFLEWALANGYDPNLTLDRIDPKKDYTPENCRWADYYTQSQNRKTLKSNVTGINGVALRKQGDYRAYITRNGKRMSLGLHLTLEAAQEARQRAEAYFEEFGTLEGHRPTLRRKRANSTN